jgi:hypothetical protein
MDQNKDYDVIFIATSKSKGVRLEARYYFEMDRFVIMMDEGEGWTVAKDGRVF